MKYIPVDKLIAEIEKWSDGKLTLSLLIEIKELITSLQQEQPEIKSHIENLLKECADNPGEYYRGHREALAHLFYYLGGNPAKYLHFIEQPEVDLEKELIQWHKRHFKKTGTYENYSGFYLENISQLDLARYFYELGLNSRKS